MMGDAGTVAGLKGCQLLAELSEQEMEELIGSFAGLCLMESCRADVTAYSSRRGLFGSSTRLRTAWRALLLRRWPLSRRGFFPSPRRSGKELVDMLHEERLVHLGNWF